MKNTHSSIVFPLFISKTDVALVINTGHKVTLLMSGPCIPADYLVFCYLCDINNICNLLNPTPEP